MYGLTASLGLTNLLANYAIGVVRRVENDGLKFAKVDISLFIKDALIGTHVDDFTYYASLVQTGLVDFNNDALQRQFILVDDRCIHVGTRRDRESNLLYLIWHVVGRHDAEVVALYNVALGGKADGCHGRYCVCQKVYRYGRIRR